jgi:hypothetical protein
VKARSSGDGARDVGDVLGGKGDKGVFVLTSVGPGTSSWQRSEKTGRGVTGLRGCDGIRGGGDWGRPGSLTRGANGPETGDDLVRSLGEPTGRKSGVVSGVGGCIGGRFGAGAGRVRWMIGIGIGIGMSSAGSARSFCWLGGCVRPRTSVAMSGFNS